ncbi:MAG: energy-coupling factor transporter transmembrane protein EcfT [Ruminococcaceae bacterium]|nr:energy-coupling factor transporter transmembrane protein EcfT [Oscillospiraceae bacterium]
MLSDITLGQYFPGKSFIHRLDPRSKILMIIAYIVMTFIIDNFTGYIVLGVFLLICMVNTRIPVKFMIKGLKPVVFFIVFTAVFNLFLTKTGQVIFKWGFLTVTDEGAKNAAFMILRLIFLVMGTSLLTLTTSPIMLTDGIERLLSPFGLIGLPHHEIAMMMSIALRFIPTLIEETDKITKAQTARGADFESGNLLRRIKAMVPVLIPLFVGAFRRADELATAMECRCYRGGKGRTRLNVLKLGIVDLIGWIVVAVFVAGIVLTNYYGVF